MRLPDPKPKWPKPEKNEWDQDFHPILEFGTIAELKAELARILQYQLQKMNEQNWSEDDEFSPTWPYTKAGLDFLRCIRIVDAIVRQMEKSDTVDPTAMLRCN